MSYEATLFRKVSPDPRAQVWPCTQAAHFFVVQLAASGTQDVQVTATPFNAHRDWLLGTFNVLSFAIKKDRECGALRVDIDPGDGTFYESFIFPLTGEDVVDTLTGFEIGGLAARFIFINGLGPHTNAFGWVQLRSW